MKIRENFVLKSLNTFGIAVKTDYFVEFFTNQEIITFVKTNLADFPTHYVLGGGSNILFLNDFKGIILKISTKGFAKVEEDNASVTLKANAGEIWDEFVKYTVDNNWGGLENLSLIPGSVGASPIQNIGAYGVEVKDTLYAVEVIDLQTGEIKIIKASDCKLSYRNSIFKEEVRGKYIILSASYKLSKVPSLNISYGAIKNELERLEIENPDIKQVRKAICNIRTSKLPDPNVLGNAGSFFKNPEINQQRFDELINNFPDLSAHRLPNGDYKLAAGWLIEQTGWKGKRLGNVGVHEKQALVLVNYGNATGNEVFDLALKIRNSVSEKFGINLKMEVNRV